MIDDELHKFLLSFYSIAWASKKINFSYVVLGNDKLFTYVSQQLIARRFGSGRDGVIWDFLFTYVIIIFTKTMMSDDLTWTPGESVASHLWLFFIPFGHRRTRGGLH